MGQVLVQNSHVPIPADAAYDMWSKGHYVYDNEHTPIEPEVFKPESAYNMTHIEADLAPPFDPQPNEHIGHFQRHYDEIHAVQADWNVEAEHDAAGIRSDPSKPSIHDATVKARRRPKLGKLTHP
jgi:hypothetical protein